MSPGSPEAIGIAILTKAPVPGRVKTRLAMMLGVDGATALHERFVTRTVEAAAEAATGPITLWASPDETHPFFQALAQRIPLAFARQPEGDLGQRMHVAITQANGPTIVVGTDCPLMTATHLRDAAEVLRGGSDAVIYPAEDGGYVLIGMRRAHSGAVHQHALEHRRGHAGDAPAPAAPRPGLARAGAAPVGRRPADRRDAHAARRHDRVARGN